MSTQKLHCLHTGSRIVNVPAISYMYTSLPVCMSLCLIIGNLLKSVTDFCVACMKWLDLAQLTTVCCHHSLSLGCWGDEWPQLAIHRSRTHLWTQGWYPGALAPPPRGFGGDALQLQNLWVWIGFVLLPAGLGGGFGASGTYYIRDIRSRCVEVSLGVDKTSNGLRCQHACLMTFLLINICGCNRRSGLWILVFFFIMSVYGWKWHPYSPVE